MKLIFAVLVIILTFLMGFKTPIANAQLDVTIVLPRSSNSITPSASPAPTVIASPQSSDLPQASSSPGGSPTSLPKPNFPTFPPIIIPMFTDPTPMPLPSSTPRPTLPLFFQVQSSPPPETEQFDATYRSIVAPALSFVTQTNVEEFYRDQSLSEHTANLLYAIAFILMAVGVGISSQDLFIQTVRKIREKELVQYFYKY